MSAITRAAEHARMVKDLAELKALVEQLQQRVKALEEKRGPGRPKANG